MTLAGTRGWTLRAGGCMDVIAHLIAHLAGAFTIFAFLAHIGTILVARWRLRVPPEGSVVPGQTPPVTIIRPVCGVDAYEEQTLRSTFKLDYPSYEILFCCATAEDP